MVANNSIFLIAPIFFVVFKVCVLAKTTLKITKIECPTFQPDIVKNVSCRIGKSSDGSTSIIGGFSPTEDVWDAKGIYQLTVQMGSFQNNRTVVELDYCNAFESLRSDYIIRLLLEDFMRATNIPNCCPFKKNVFYYFGYTANTKLIPSYVPELDFISHLPVNIKKKKAFSFTIYGGIVRK